MKYPVHLVLLVRMLGDPQETQGPLIQTWTLTLCEAGDGVNMNLLL